MHFVATAPSFKMMTDLTSSASDFCVVFGIFDYLGIDVEIDLGSRQNAASVVLTPRVSEASLCLDIVQLTISQFVLRLRRGTSQHAHHFLRMLDMQTARDRRLRETSDYFRINKQQMQLSKEPTRRQTKNLFDCVKLQIAQKSWRSGNSFTQDLQETALECSAYFVEELADQPVLKFNNYFDESVQEATLDRSKIVLPRRKIWHRCEGHARGTLRCWFG